GTVKFKNDQIVPILGYGDLVQGVVTIKRVYYVEGLNHNLFSVGQFCDADLEVAFRKSTCYIHDFKENDLLAGSRGTDLYSITLQDTNYPNLISLMAKATSSQAWLWHRRLSHLNFDTINLLSKNDIVLGLPKLKFVKDHLCSSWILHQMSVARTPEQNGFVERRNRTLVEAARTMLSAAKVPLFFWAEAIATVYLDHTGCLDSRKSTSGGIQFLGGDKLVSWSSKKQDCTSMSSVEAEYVSLYACYAQVLWMRTRLTDYGFHFDKIPMYCDSKAAIAIS
nr:integrase, catalytic region, zinc finger, CCHC-type, peptidase aspartic, catalytic [Tanacetum cinerariifolium]